LVLLAAAAYSNVSRQAPIFNPALRLAGYVCNPMSAGGQPEKNSGGHEITLINTITYGRELKPACSTILIDFASELA
jgi:hypothetical protein